MPRHAKFCEKSDLAFSSRNLTWEGVKLEEDAPERRGFWDGVDLRLGAIKQTNARKREGERQTRRKAPNKLIYKNINN